MIGETTDALSRLGYLRHRSSAGCAYLMINETGHACRACLGLHESVDQVCE
jgi:hypothetical protein